MSGSFFSGVQEAPPVEVFKLTEDYKADPSPVKVSLGVGAYRDSEGKPWILPVVKKAERQLAEDIDKDAINHEYLPVLGYGQFSDAAVRLILGSDSAAIKDERTIGVQSLSGTGALRIGAEFIIRQLGSSVVLVSDPTWGNHNLIFKYAGYKDVRKYRYWNAQECNLNIAGMLEDLNSAPEGAVVILHSCAHNPTGIDPSKEQWKSIADAVERKKLIPFFDSAYQGFASGNPDADAWAVRYFADERKLELFCAQSFSKNFGLYNERAGNLTVVLSPSAAAGSTGQVASSVKSQLTLVARAMYSNPPAHGARTVEKVLCDPQLRAEWAENVKTMAARTLEMRSGLRTRLEKLSAPGAWKHITDQIGMFSFTGLTPEMCEFLVKKKHVYLPRNGRVSMCGVTPLNMDYVAESFNEAVAKFKKE